MDCNPICEEIGKMFIAMSSYKISLGLVGTWVLAIFIGWLFGKITRQIQDNLEKDIDSLIEKVTITEEIKKKWKNIIDIGDKLTSPTKWLGIFEITFFYACLFFQPAGIGAWLVFKVAAKWESWTNIVKVPDKIKSGEQELDEFEYLELRNKLATAVSQKFLIGTLGNILAAAVGFGLFCIIRYIYK